MATDAERVEEAYRLLNELGLTGWSVQIIPSPGLFAETPPQLLVRVTRDDLPPIERLCVRTSDVAREIAETARWLEGLQRVEMLEH